jgi:hypothetical protein
VKTKGFMCGVDFQHDFGHADITFYTSAEQLKRSKPCWKQCGIVEVEIEIKLLSWTEPQDFSQKNEVPG